MGTARINQRSAGKLTKRDTLRTESNLKGNTSTLGMHSYLKLTYHQEHIISVQWFYTSEPIKMKH